MNADSDPSMPIALEANKTAKIADVAREAGVSVASVSRVLSGSRQVRGPTREAVLKAAKKLGYQANYLASALRSRSTRTIGMIVPHIANPFFIELVEKIENVLQGQGFDLFLCDSQNSTLIEEQRMRALVARQVDGIVLICADGKKTQKFLPSFGDQVPIVTIDRTIEGMVLDLIEVDNSLGIQMVIGHLVGIGCRSMAFVGAKSEISTAKDRLDAYRRYVAAVDPASCDDVLLESYSVEWGDEAGQQIGERPRRPDAIVCANDLIALGVIRGLARKGIKVPRDIAVTGFDDIAIARYVDPGITSVRQPVDDIARETAAVLLARIGGTAGAVRHLMVRPELVVRQSTGRREA